MHTTDIDLETGDILELGSLDAIVSFFNKLGYDTGEPAPLTPEAIGLAGDAAKALKKHGATVVGVSKDSIESHCKFIDKHDLNFELLSDPDGKVLEKYGAWGEKKNYGKVFEGIIRSTFVIDETGEVEKAYRSVRAKGHVDRIKADLLV